MSAGTRAMSTSSIVRCVVSPLRMWGCGGHDKVHYLFPSLQQFLARLEGLDQGQASRTDVGTAAAVHAVLKVEALQLGLVPGQSHSGTC